MNIKLEKKEIRLITISVIIGLIIGWMFFYTGEITKSHNHEETADVETIWTCSMHPQIKMSEPGLCPICAMDLVPIGLVTSSEEYDVQISESAVQLANIQTTLVKKKQPEKSIQLFGTVQPDDRNISQITARFNGRIEDLQINFIGQNVKKGQIIGSIAGSKIKNIKSGIL
jgi:membrane fusion protein, copper/silver efflux system